MIQFSHVSKIYDGKFTALDDVSFFIDKGEFVFLTGASGAGKTTLLKHIYMEEKPTSGQVVACGTESRYVRPRHIPFLRRKLGIVFQDFKLLSDRDVFENVAFPLRVTGEHDRVVKRKVFEVLAQTGLSHKRSYYPAQLSGGEQQRVCIARSIVNDPWVVMADEPTGNLDSALSQEILSLLKTINSWGTTVIMSTHDLSIVRQHHYRHLVMDKGRLVCGSERLAKPKAWGIGVS